MILDPSHNSFQNNSLHHDCHNPPPSSTTFIGRSLQIPLKGKRPTSRGRVYFPFFGHGFKTFVHTVKNTVMRTLIGSDGVRRVRVGHMSLPRSFFSAISCHSSRVSGFLQTSCSMLVCWYGVPNWGRLVYSWECLPRRLVVYSPFVHVFPSSSILPGSVTYVTFTVCAWSYLTT